eukprot:m.86362 g.86362  ORF g.86362 m.86362 type:complete len:168 (-) comp11451_c0_seq3:13-516(-)
MSCFSECSYLRPRNLRRLRDQSPTSCSKVVAPISQLLGSRTRMETHQDTFHRSRQHLQREEPFGLTARSSNPYRVLPLRPWCNPLPDERETRVMMSSPSITFRSDACFRAQAPQTVGDNHGAQSAFSLAEHASCTGDPLTTECVVAKSSCSAVNPSILSGSSAINER